MTNEKRQENQQNPPEPGVNTTGRRGFDWRRVMAALRAWVSSLRPDPAAVNRPAATIPVGARAGRKRPNLGGLISGFIRPRRLQGSPRRRRKAWLRSQAWRVSYFVEHMARAERTWGSMRLIAVAVAVGFFVFLSWRFADSGSPLLSLRTLRHIIIPLAAFLGAFLVAGHYLQEIYELPQTRQALRYLFPALFGKGYPVLRIENGARQVQSGEINLVDTIGGPGLLIVQPGNAVLCERLTEPATVFGGGFHFLTRYETVKEIVSLQDQHGWIEQTPATTKDGIEVMVRDIQYRYRVRNGRRYGDYNRRTPQQPYPFSMQAIRNLTYSRTVSASGISQWHHMVRLAVDAVITDYVQSVPFDKLTSPRFGETDPRIEINTRLQKRELRERLKRTGAELLWCDIGRFDPPGKADDTHVDYWSVPWAGETLVQHAYGEASRLALQELGRAEAQADMVKSILLSLSEINLATDHTTNVRKLILIRTAQILEAMAEPPRTSGPASPPSLKALEG